MEAQLPADGKTECMAAVAARVKHDVFSIEFSFYFHVHSPFFLGGGASNMGQSMLFTMLKYHWK